MDIHPDTTIQPADTAGHALDDEATISNNGEIAESTEAEYDTPADAGGHEAEGGSTPATGETAESAEAEKTTPSTSELVESIEGEVAVETRPWVYDVIVEYVMRIVALRIPKAAELILRDAIRKASGCTEKTVAQAFVDARNVTTNGIAIRTLDDAVAAMRASLDGDFASIVYTAGMFYGYRDPSVAAGEEPAGCYVRIPEYEVMRRMTALFRGTTFAQTAASRREILIRLQSATYVEDFFADAPEGINLRDCFLGFDSEDGAVVQYAVDPETKARDRLMVDYDPLATAPTFLDGLARVLPDEAKRIAVQEFFGALAFGVVPGIDKERGAAFFLGASDSGKSSTIECSRLLVPAYAITSLSPDSWADRHTLVDLAGFKLNVVTELDHRKKIPGKQLKQVVSREPICDRHPHRANVIFTPVARHLFAANSPPPVDDKSGAFQRRVLAVTFDRSLTRDEKIPDFLDRVRGELAGLVNWAAEGATRLHRRGYFDLPPGHLEAVTEMQFGCDPVQLFARLRVEADPGNQRGVPNGELREALKTFAEGRGIDTSDWGTMTNMRQLSDTLADLYGCERHASGSTGPVYRFIRLV